MLAEVCRSVPAREKREDRQRNASTFFCNLNRSERKEMFREGRELSDEVLRRLSTALVRKSKCRI